MKVRVAFPWCTSVEMDCVFATLTSGDVPALTEDGRVPLNELRALCSDNVDRAALAGPVFLHNVHRHLPDDTVCRPFVASIEAVARYLSTKRLKGSQFGLPRTFHLVEMMAFLVGAARHTRGAIAHPPRTRGRAWCTVFLKAARRLVSRDLRRRSATASAATAVEGGAAVDADLTVPPTWMPRADDLVVAFADAVRRMDAAAWAEVTGDTVPSAWLPYVTAVCARMHKAFAPMRVPGADVQVDAWTTILCEVRPVLVSGLLFVCLLFGVLPGVGFALLSCCSGCCRVVLAAVLAGWLLFWLAGCCSALLPFRGSSSHNLPCLCSSPARLVSSVDRLRGG